jgi:SAM-dependent methyltransferase
MDFLGNAAASHARVWDVGCGNGQAAIALAARFQHVIATDICDGQIANAFRHPRVEYRVAPASNSQIPAQTVDAICCSQSLHWFQGNAFFDEAVRVGTQRCIFAAWCYGIPAVSRQLDPCIEHLYWSLEWPDQKRHVDTGYQEIAIPFSEEIDTPDFTTCAQWDLSQFKSYIETWPMINCSPTELQARLANLSAAWGHPLTRRMIVWPLSVRVGRLA